MPEVELTSLCDNAARRRGPNRTFYGWAEISVQCVEKKCDMKVISTPTGENPCHADIEFPDQVVADEVKHTMLAQYLANHSRFRMPVRT